MCDCEELELEDFETMLTAISKMSAAPVAETPEVPLVQVSRKRNR